VPVQGCHAPTRQFVAMTVAGQLDQRRTGRDVPGEDVAGAVVHAGESQGRQFSSCNIGMYEMPTIAPSGDCSLATV
jgi:hypothetical protein